MNTLLTQLNLEHKNYLIDHEVIRGFIIIRIFTPPKRFDKNCIANYTRTLKSSTKAITNEIRGIILGDINANNFAIKYKLS